MHTYARLESGCDLQLILLPFRTDFDEGITVALLEAAQRGEAVLLEEILHLCYCLKGTREGIPKVVNPDNI